MFNYWGTGFFSRRICFFSISIFARCIKSQSIRLQILDPYPQHPLKNLASDLGPVLWNPHRSGGCHALMTVDPTGDYQLNGILRYFSIYPALVCHISGSAFDLT
jgi:hypothetical protein